MAHNKGSIGTWLSEYARKISFKLFFFFLNLETVVKEIIPERAPGINDKLCGVWQLVLS